MIGVLTGFAVIAAIIGLGWIIARVNLLGPGADQVLSRLAFFVLTPLLLLTVLSEADVSRLFSSLIPISAIAAVSCFLIATVIARFVWRRGVPETTIVALASGYVNANNIGLPIAIFVLGDAALAAPVILLNLTVFAPIALAILDVSTSGRVSIGRILLQPMRNPIIVASLLGVLLAVTGLRLPEVVLEPVRLVGGAAVPIILLLFGMSLHGVRVLAPGTGRRDALLATALKVVVMPTIAWLVGWLVFGLSGMPLFTVVVFAALPAAQHVFSWAHRFDRHVAVARDAVLLSTIGAVPALLVIAATLAPR